MSDFVTDLSNQKMSKVLDSLDQEYLSPEEAKLALQDKIAQFSQPSFEYDDSIDFDDQNAIQKDLVIARNVIMDALDKSNKLSELVFEALMVDSTNPLFLQMAQSTTSTIQSTVKTLTEVHNSYHKIVGQKKRNDLVGESKPSETKEDSGFTFGSGHKHQEN